MNPSFHLLRLAARQCTVCCCAASLVACTSARVLADGGSLPAGAPPSLLLQLVPDDMLRVSTRDGRLTELRVTAVSAQMLDGVDAASGQLVHLPADQIASVERREKDAGKTVALVTGIAVGVAVAVHLLIGLVVP